MVSDEGPHRGVDVLREHGVGAGADLLLGLLREAGEQVWKEASEPQLVGGAVGPDGLEPMFEEVLDAQLDLVADEADLVECLAGRVGDVPVLDDRGNERASGAAREGDGPVGVQLHLGQQLPRALVREVDADLPHGGDHFRPDLLARRVAGGLGADVFGRRAVEERLGHLGAASVVGADEEHVLHSADGSRFH